MDKIVKDGLFKREYYTLLENGGIEYKCFEWVSNWGKYLPNFNMEFELDNGDTWKEFCIRKEKQGFIDIEKAIEIGPKRK